MAVAVPHSEEAELAVLGACLMEPDAVLRLSLLKPSDFWQPRHRTLWRIMAELAMSGRPGDALVIFREVERRGLIEETGGRDYIATLASAASSPIHAEHHAAIILEKSGLRRLSALGERLVAAVEAGEGYEDCLRLAHDTLFDASQPAGGREGTPISEALYQVLGVLQGKDEPGRVCPTQLHVLDDLLAGGHHAGELTLVAARPGVGKSLYANNLCLRTAMGGGKVLLFSLEMTAESIARNILSAQTLVSGDRMRKGSRFIGEKDMERLAAAAGDIGNTGLVVNDSASVSISSIRREAQAMKMRGGLDLLVVDYLQLMETQGSRSRSEDLGKVSRGLKILAKDLGVPVVALSQLNRDSEQRESHRPRLSDLRESGSLEQDADVVLMLHRDYLFTRNLADANVAEVIVAKNRHGPTDTVKVGFVGEYLLLRNLTREDSGH